MEHFATAHMTLIQSFMATAIIDAKLYAFPFPISLHETTFLAVKIKETVGQSRQRIP